MPELIRQLFDVPHLPDEAQIHIQGVERLSGARHPVMPDRIEAGTYAMAVTMTGGDVLLEGATETTLGTPIDILRAVGAEVTATNHGLRIKRNGGGLSPVETELAQSRGFMPVRLGPRILRTETAALATLSAIQALWGDF